MIQFKTQPVSDSKIVCTLICHSGAVRKGLPSLAWRHITLLVEATIFQWWPLSVETQCTEDTKHKKQTNKQKKT